MAARQRDVSRTSRGDVSRTARGEGDAKRNCTGAAQTARAFPLRVEGGRPGACLSVAMFHYAMNDPSCVADAGKERAAAATRKAAERAARRELRAARLAAALKGRPAGAPPVAAEADSDSEEDDTPKDAAPGVTPPDSAAPADAAAPPPAADASASAPPSGPREKLAAAAAAAFLKAHAASDAVGLTDAFEQAQRAARLANAAAASATAAALGACGLRRAPAGVDDDDDAESESSSMAPGPSGRTLAQECKDAGNAAFKRGKFEAALRSYTRAADLDDKSAVYQANRAAALMQLKRPGEAAEACVAALSIDAGNARARQRLATLCTDGALLDATIAAADARPNLGVLSAQLRCVAAARLEGRGYFENGEFGRAEVAYGRGLAAATDAGPRGAPPPPGAALLLCNRAAARAALGRHSEALEDADAALALAPSYEKAAARRAVEVRLLADTARATATSERDAVVAELRSLGVPVPDVERGAALGDNAWGRAPCAACVPLGRDARACRASFGHVTPDIEPATWRVGGRVRFSRRAAAVGRGASIGASLATVAGAAAAAEGDELTVEGTIVGFDWPSGLHGVARDRGKGTLHVRLRACQDLTYMAPSAAALPDVS